MQYHNLKYDVYSTFHNNYEQISNTLILSSWLINIKKAWWKNGKNIPEEKHSKRNPVLPACIGDKNDCRNSICTKYKLVDGSLSILQYQIPKIHQRKRSPNLTMGDDQIRQRIIKPEPFENTFQSLFLIKLKFAYVANTMNIKGQRSSRNWWV
jgi:hypothetical protein